MGRAWSFAGWYCRSGDILSGPFRPEQIKNLVMSRRLRPSDRVWEALEVRPAHPHVPGPGEYGVSGQVAAPSESVRSRGGLCGQKEAGKIYRQFGPAIGREG